jgi:hypothetical protein
MEGSVIPSIPFSSISIMSPTVLNVLVPNMTSTFWVSYTYSRNHGVMKKHFFTGWQEEGFDTTEISLIQWIWMDYIETDISTLRSDTLEFLDAF